MLRRTAALAGPLILSVVLCPTAAAGPLSWTYIATVQAGNGLSTPPASAMLALTQFPTGGSAATAAVAVDSDWTALPTGGSGSMSGSGTIVLASSSKGDVQTGSAAPAGTVDSFRTLLQITDADSGARGFTYMNGKGWLVDGTGGSGEVQLDGSGRVLMDLGKHRYDITWHKDETATTTRIVADVSVSSLVNTPEPATLALAGLGLGAVGLRRLRRRG